ncbi:dethiobiotin synthase [Aphanomyces invadans]|uniref:Dethiobiotin synthase n=1 Tax=Aphanomyces invadans TaxID=157072 RepID=A0A024UR15_9STRA|nr:dethiobiotin synthase [Aphanomyces invadans]ETW08053.1 dethiobiotin synthase [Aphanomyces invadans]|eukprot:XP_008864146.1 dethiobiotin synthase [Aphanomyces invadans]
MLSHLGRRSFSARAAPPRAGLLHAGCNLQRDSTPSKQYVPNAVSVSLQSPIVQVFGSNTDVGKTIVSAGLCRAAVQSSSTSTVGYIKPLQTGGDSMMDARFLRSHMDATRLSCETLFSWDTPVSPHLAAHLEDKSLTDDILVNRLSSTLNALQANASTLMVVETAGGVCSPSASGRFQCDVYRPLRLPSVLVGDGKLGGISATMSALDSLLLRGYDVPWIVLIEQDDLDNAAAIADRAAELNISVFALPKLPPQPTPLHDWYSANDESFASILDAITAYHHARVDRLHAISSQAQEILWWPFTQHKQNKGVLVIDSAYGDSFATYNASRNSLEPMVDACASWWTQGLGHGNPKAALAVATTAARYGHVMFPENAHEPAVQVAAKLLDTVGRNWASRVFFSDDGSTAVEVALKMAFRTFVTSSAYQSAPANADKELVVLAQTNCYHGDTLGVMHVAEPSVFNMTQHPWYKPKAMFAAPPTVSVSGTDGHVRVTWPEVDAAFHVQLESMDALFNGSSRQASAAAYTAYVTDLLDNHVPPHALVGALVVEPVLIGAGGMHFVDPLFQRTMVNVCRSRGIPVVFDEVFSGLWRLGAESARNLLQVDPDIACYAKLLTGGVVPLAATLATRQVFDAFQSDAKADALLHGHSFTANPVGCAAALTALDMYDSLANTASVTREYWNPSAVAAIAQNPRVIRAFQLGTVAVFELESSTKGYDAPGAQEYIRHLRVDGIYARALGNVIYVMCSPFTTRDACRDVLETIARVLS